MPHSTRLIQSSVQRETGASLHLHSLHELDGFELDRGDLNRDDLNQGILNRVGHNSLIPTPIDPDGALSSVLAAAVINRRFCRLLLTNPSAALAMGYRGELFLLSTAEKELLLRIRASTLREFAQLLLVEIQRQNAP